MKNYSPYWRTTFFVAIVLHFLGGLGFSYVLPHLLPEPKPKEVQELSWVDVDLIAEEEVTVVEEEPEPIAMPSRQELFATDFPPIVLPPPPEPVFVESPPPQPEIVEQPKTPAPPPQIVKDEAEVKKKLENDAPENQNIVVVPKESKQLLGEPPVTIEEFYPPKGSGLGYRGYVSVAATIGTDGKVKRTKVMRTSGRLLVDGLAQDYAKKWTFKPALDQEGKPMECDKIITFDFRKFA